jgi:hypothetical protein
MTPKQQLLLQIETLPDPVLEELLDFLLIIRLRYHRQQQTTLPLGQFINTLVADIPPHVIQTWPTDGAEQHDHYLYGMDKAKEE